MANINVKKRLERISDDIDQVLKHIAQYSGVDRKEAPFIDNLATGIAQQASRIAAAARATEGDRTAPNLPKKVRKALGFSYP
jgi:hypothetical protein